MDCKEIIKKIKCATTKKELKRNKEKVAFYLLLFIFLILILVNGHSLLNGLIENFKRINSEYSLMYDYALDNNVFIEKLKAQINSFINYWQHFLDPVTVEKKPVLDFFIENLILNPLTAVANFINGLSSFLLIIETAIIVLVLVLIIRASSINSQNLGFITTKPAKIKLKIINFFDGLKEKLKSFFKFLKKQLRDYKRLLSALLIAVLLLKNYFSLFILDLIGIAKNSLYYIVMYMEDPNTPLMGVYALGRDFVMFFLALYSKFAFTFPYLNIVLIIFIIIILLKLSVKSNLKKAKKKFIENWIGELYE